MTLKEAERLAKREIRKHKLNKIYEFGNHYVSNFVTKSKINKGIKAPLNLVYCNKCKLLQLEHSAPQEIMYKKFYWYRSSVTKTMRDGLKDIYKSSLKYVNLDRTIAQLNQTGSALFAALL